MHFIFALNCNYVASGFVSETRSPWMSACYFARLNLHDLQTGLDTDVLLSKQGMRKHLTSHFAD